MYSSSRCQIVYIASIEKFTFHLRIMLPFGSAFAGALCAKAIFHCNRRGGFSDSNYYFVFIGKFEFDDTKVFVKEFVVTSAVRLRYLQNKLYAQWQCSVWKHCRFVWTIDLKKIAQGFTLVISNDSLII